MVAGVACDPRAQGLSRKISAPTPSHATGQAAGAVHESYLGLGASATNSVNPDVLSLDATALVKGHVLHELSTGKASQYEYPSLASRAIVKIQCSEDRTYILRVGDDS